jgi:hypothetical protein
MFCRTFIWESDVDTVFRLESHYSTAQGTSEANCAAEYCGEMHKNCLMEYNSRT